MIGKEEGRGALGAEAFTLMRGIPTLGRRVGRTKASRAVWPERRGRTFLPRGFCLSFTVFFLTILVRFRFRSPPPARLRASAWDEWKVRHPAPSAPRNVGLCHPPTHPPTHSLAHDIAGCCGIAGWPPSSTSPVLSSACPALAKAPHRPPSPL